MLSRQTFLNVKTDLIFWQNVVFPDQTFTVLGDQIRLALFTSLLFVFQVTLSGVYSAMGVFIGSSVVPIILGTFWTRMTSKAMASGAIIGMLLGITAWVVSASVLYQRFDLSAFLTNSNGNGSVQRHWRALF